MNELRHVDVAKLYRLNVVQPREKNVFRGIFTNPIFYGIWIVTFIVQILLVQYGSFAFACVALTLEQWMWCFFFGFTVLLWNQVTARRNDRCSEHLFCSRWLI